MGDIVFSQEIIEHILQFADGETLLMCRDVSSQFAAAVTYLGQKKNKWKKCYFEEEDERYPYAVISKLYPHFEGLNHPKDWKLIYETCHFRSNFLKKNSVTISEVVIAKEYSEIRHVQTHGDLTLALVHYNKNYSYYYKIVTVDVNNFIIDKSAKCYTDYLYITPIEDLSLIKHYVIPLRCNSCNLVAVPTDVYTDVEGCPKFKNNNYLIVEHLNGETLWLDRYLGLLNKGNCFHMGKDSNNEEIESSRRSTVKIFQRYTSLVALCGRTTREINTFKKLQANVTASLSYSNILIIGTDTGMIYVYHLKNESELKTFDLDCYISRYTVCRNPILNINVMELKTQFVIVCCTEKSLYRLEIDRN